MVIRFTKATRFFCVCVLLLLTALISIGTRSMSVSAPYNTRHNTLPVVVYRSVESGSPTALSLRELKEDLDYLVGGDYYVLSEQELVAALRLERAIVGRPVLLLFDNRAENFAQDIQPLLEERELPWFSLEQSTILTRELRAAGFPITRLERSGAFTLEEQLNMR